MSSDSLVLFYFEDLTLGQKAHFAKTITETDIVLFAGVSGDFNPVHVNAEYAKNTPFKQRIAHGMLSGAFISAVLAMQMPGPGAIYISQQLKFRAPVLIGDTLTAHAEVVGLNPDKKFVTLKTTCTVGDKVVVDGEAVVMMPARA